MTEKVITKPEYPDVLADRYASPEMVRIWSPEQKVKTERKYWIAVMRAQAELGMDISPDIIKAYEKVVDVVNLDSMRAREKITHHDIVAHIEEFNALAGHEAIHKGMTSRDVTENVEALQIRDSLLLVRDKTIAVVVLMAAIAVKYANLAMVGRSHNVPAQLTTLGKRFANYGEETLEGLANIENIIANYPLRGIKGPVGTQQDMLDAFNGDAGKIAEFEKQIAKYLGFNNVLDSVGQIYPRSLDSKVVHALFEASAGPTNMAIGIRHMAGLDLVTEGFSKGQVGSSAMPHKMNAAKSERIDALRAIILGFSAMTDTMSGKQWNEGDVSCSAVRRVALPGAFFASDGINETSLAVLKGFGVYPNVIDKEISKYAPFVSTTKILMALQKAGVGRETAHGIIKEHAVQLALDMRTGGDSQSLYERLGNDERVPMTAIELEAIANKPLELVGLAPEQARAFVAKVNAIISKYPEAAVYDSRGVL